MVAAEAPYKQSIERRQTTPGFGADSSLKRGMLEGARETCEPVRLIDIQPISAEALPQYLASGLIFPASSLLSCFTVLNFPPFPFVYISFSFVSRPNQSHVLFDISRLLNRLRPILSEFRQSGTARWPRPCGFYRRRDHALNQDLSRLTYLDTVDV
uniref:Uncharacterized protein n=1 Tax=Bionectria ochroleuca TaxID=29856 RepID=A0A8H7NCI5_BIOOC